MPSPSAGDFKSFGFSESTVLAYTDFYDTITRLKMWDVMAEEVGVGGYSFSEDPRINTIIYSTEYMNDYGGNQIGRYMREMQFIAQNGWDAFVASPSGQ